MPASGIGTAAVLKLARMNGFGVEDPRSALDNGSHPQGNP